MKITFLDVFDQFRFIGGTIFAELIFVMHTVPKKQKFLFRSMVGFLVCFLLSMTYLPLSSLLVMGEHTVVFAFVISVWWLLASLITIFYIMYCYEISICNAMFRCILGLALQQIVTVVLRYCIVGIWFPGFPEKYPLMYIALTIVLYILFYGVFHYTVACRMQNPEGFAFLDSRKMLYIYIFLILAFSILSDVTTGIFELVLKPIASFGELNYVRIILQYFCIGVILVVCAVIFVIQYNVYEIAFLQQEKELLKRLQLEKEKQYEYSKENIDIINQKCHDLKHQIQALKLADELERESLIEETRKAVLFYDSVVKTDNEVLNTILTEKSLICAKHRIRLSCTVNAKNMGNIAVVDWYTILGNALDNAIECVNQYEDDEKKVISISIHERGKLLNIIIDNYFEGNLEIKNGFPVTSKKDKAYHGYGMKSIRMLTRKYGGDIRISNINHTFSLQILIPI